MGEARAVRTALLHYWLTNMRGGEKVLAALGGMFPEADVFTHAFGNNMRDKAEGRGGAGQWRGHTVYESFIASLPFGRRKPQVYLPLMAAASRSLKLDGYDLIISSESGPIKGVAKPKNVRHICYCHTPMRYVWDMYDDYYRDAGLLGKLAMPLFVRYMRREDLKSAESVDTFVANSHFVAERIRRIYGRDSVVVHPPVDVEFFSAASKSDTRSYYLFAGAPVKYKRLDLAKAACAKMGRELRVAGGGSCTDTELRSLYAGAKALIFPGVEDFGIVPVEAQAAGTPVIAFGAGGALETVKNQKTGLFFEEQTIDGLCGAIEEFEGRSWSPEACKNNAVRFSARSFVRSMSEVCYDPTK